MSKSFQDGRKEYFPSRGIQLDVTELLIKRSLRVTNSRIATLRGNVIYGRSPGKTDLKVRIQIRSWGSQGP